MNVSSVVLPDRKGAIVYIPPNAVVTSNISGPGSTTIITPPGSSLTTYITSQGSNVTFLNALPPVPPAPPAPPVPYNASYRYYVSLDAAVYIQRDGSHLFYFIPYYAVHLPTSNQRALQANQSPVNPFTNPYVQNNTFANKFNNGSFEYLNLSEFNSLGYRSSDDDYFYNIYGVR